MKQKTDHLLILSTSQVLFFNVSFNSSSISETVTFLFKHKRAETIEAETGAVGKVLPKALLTAKLYKGLNSDMCAAYQRD